VSTSPVASSGWLARNLGGSWTIRRRIIVATLGMCGEVLLYAQWLIWRTLEDLPKNKADLMSTMVNGAYILAGSVIGSYVFGAVWDDKSKRGGDVGGTDNG